MTSVFFKKIEYKRKNHIIFDSVVCPCCCDLVPLCKRMLTSETRQVMFWVMNILAY